MGYRNQRNYKNQKRRLVITDQRQFKKSIAILLFIILACILIYATRKTFVKLYTSFVSSNDFVAESTNEFESSDSNEDKNEKEVPEDLTFSMAVTGDIMCHNTQFADAKLR